ncbi:uncharacterized protein LOC118453812 [Neolamprologus brichardi]|uniref:uncharacterized protein LOC118453812 n=1 Tax=Neolamprologus brichardi TaxID=32507 RepID=UPI0016439142|nr:uncharacterized protein LOC118453812 [Neolamprologus brichardi]
MQQQEQPAWSPSQRNTVEKRGAKTREEDSPLPASAHACGHRQRPRTGRTDSRTANHRKHGGGNNKLLGALASTNQRQRRAEEHHLYRGNEVSAESSILFQTINTTNALRRAMAYKVLRGGAKPMYTDPQKLPGIIPGDPRRPIPVLSSSNHSHEARDSSSKRKQREPPGFFSRLLPRPFTRALETLFGGRRKGELSGRGSDAEFFGPNGLLGEVWDDEMSSSMLGTRMKKVVQNYQAMNKYGVELSGPGGVSGTPKLSGPELLCQLKDKVEVATLTPDLQPFSLLPWATQLPPQQLTSDLGPYKSCAVVSSAGSLRYSGLGKEIARCEDLQKAAESCFIIKVKTRLSG